MHSNSFLLLTFGLLLATASILTASPPPSPSPSPSPPPELASKVVPVPEPDKPHGFSYYKFHVDRYNEDGKLMFGKKSINVAVSNDSLEDHKRIVADVKAYMDKNVVTNFEHPFHPSNRVHVTLGPKEVNTQFTAKFSTRKSYKNLNAHGQSNKVTRNGIGRFYYTKPGDSERKVAYIPAGDNQVYQDQYHDFPTPEDLNNIDKVPKRSSPLEERQVTVGSSKSTRKRRRDSFSSSEPRPELEEGEKIRGRVSSTSAGKRRQKSPDLKEPDPKRQRYRSPRQYPVGNPSGRGDPRPQYGSRDHYGSRYPVGNPSGRGDPRPQYGSRDHTRGRSGRY